MDAFATYDAAASQLDDPSKFWAEVDDILDPPGRPHVEIVDATLLQARLTSLLALCDACFDTHLEQQYNSDYLLTRLFASPLATRASSQVLSDSLLYMATTARSLAVLLILYDGILRHGTTCPDVFRIPPQVHQLIPRLVHHFWAAHYTGPEAVNRGVNASHARASSSSWNNVESDGQEAHGGEETGWAGADFTVSVKSQQSRAHRDQLLQPRLRNKASRMLYEVCRVQRLDPVDLRAIDARFVNHLFDLVESSRNFDDDTYNYQLIKLIVALNEQFMVSGLNMASSSTTATSKSKSAGHTHANVVLTVLRTRLNASKTFGENLIFMLNRASSLDAEDVCMQLLILKLLYLLFTTKETAHYFYTNDLQVLVDVFIRELHDLPEESDSLRHTYLRVLHPLLTNTQLLTYPYKRLEIRKLLLSLVSHSHLRDISATTKRLVDRCLNAQWCLDLDRKPGDVLPNGAEKDLLRGREQPAEQDTQRHRFMVQTIGGGPQTIVSAEMQQDSQGISIPIGPDHQAYQATPASTASTLAVAAAQIPIRIQTTGEAANGSCSISTSSGRLTVTPGRKRVYSLGAASLRDAASDEVNAVADASIPAAASATAITADAESAAIDQPGGKERMDDGRDEQERTRTELLASRTPSVRRDRGQRTVSAREAPKTPPRRESEAEGSSRRPGSKGGSGNRLLQHSGSYKDKISMGLEGEEGDDVGSDGGYEGMQGSGALSAGSSWHESMAPYQTASDGTAIPVHVTGANAHHDPIRVGSPLSQDSTDYYTNLGSGQITDEDPKQQQRRSFLQRPSLHVEAASDENVQMAMNTDAHGASIHGDGIVGSSHSSTDTSAAYQISPTSYTANTPSTSPDPSPALNATKSTGRRRPPPAPPAQDSNLYSSACHGVVDGKNTAASAAALAKRRQLLVSPSDPMLSIRRTTSTESFHAQGGRHHSTHQHAPDSYVQGSSTAVPSRASSPASGHHGSNDASPPGSLSSADQVSHAPSSTASTSTSTGARRRPPPPPPNRATKGIRQPGAATSMARAASGSISPSSFRAEGADGDTVLPVAVHSSETYTSLGSAMQGLHLDK